MEECGCELALWAVKMVGQLFVGMFLLHHHHRHEMRRAIHMHRMNTQKSLPEKSAAASRPRARRAARA